MVVDLLHRVLGRCLPALLGRVVGTVVEAIAKPCHVGELSPKNMVLQVVARLAVLDVDFLPVGTAARDDVGHVATVVGEVSALESHSAVGAELVGVEPYALFLYGRVGTVHLIEHILVLQSVVAMYIPLAVLLEGDAELLEIGGLLESLQDFGTHGDAVEIVACELVLSLNPLGSLLAGVVLEPAVRVGNFHTEILVNGVILWSRRIINLRHSRCRHKQRGGNSKDC